VTAAAAVVTSSIARIYVYIYKERERKMQSQIIELLLYFFGQ